MARIEDTYARDFFISAWSLGAYNPPHEQIDLIGSPDTDDSYLGDAGARHWLLFFGLAAILWAPVAYGVWRGFRG